MAKNPEELMAKFDEEPDLRAAVEGLKPGRRHGYVLRFSGANQSKTRTARIEMYRPQILAGKGFHDR